MRLQTAVLACALGASCVCGDTTNYLTWPFSVGSGGYGHQGQLGTGATDSFVLELPIFPASVPQVLFSALTVTVQCSGCSWASCLTVTSSSGGCPPKPYCDNAVHTCTYAMPYSNAMPTTFTLTLANHNTLASKTYTMSVSQACSTGSVLDEDACMPVTVGPYGTYRTACVFKTPESANGLMFGINGCSCSTYSNGFYSTCWNGYAPLPVTITSGAQNCAPPVCVAPPSPYPTPSQTPSASETPSNTPSASETPSVCPSPVTHSPSPSAAVSRTTSPSATVSRTASPTSTASTPPSTQPFSFGGLTGTAAVSAVVGMCTGLVVACLAAALVWRWRSQSRPRRVARVDAAIALTARGELAGTSTTAPLLDACALCPACRVENTPSARFCVACGAALTA